MKRILLIQLGANGDCLFATTIARQIKMDYPDCWLTWVIAEKYASVLRNNPYVDAIWTIALLPGETLAVETWYRVYQEAQTRRTAGDFDLIFNTQIYPDNVSNFDGVIRSSTFRNYPYPITVPISPVVVLTSEEKQRVHGFVQQNEISRYRHIVLFEVSPGSGQSCLTLERGRRLAEAMTARYSDMLILISTHLPFESQNPRIVSVGCLSFRENLELSQYCTFFVGSSSGISWLLTASEAKKLPMIQFIGGRNGFFASMVYDLKYWGERVDHIIENDTERPELMERIVFDALANFTTARSTWHKDFRPGFWYWLQFIDYRKGIRGLFCFYKPLAYYIYRNGLTFQEVFDFRILKIVWSNLFKLLLGRRG